MLNEAPATLLLCGLLLVISVQDLRTYRIANELNLLLALSGAAYWALLDAAQLPEQLAAALLSALFLWSIRQAHAKATGRIGLGMGDVKLMAAGMIWIEPPLFPFLLFAASASGLIAALSFYRDKVAGLRDARIPFGPFLCFGIICCWFLGVYQ